MSEENPLRRKREGSHDLEPPSKRSSFHPVSVKCLVPHQIAGKLLGKGGDRMRALKEIAPKLFMSKNDEYFPHTDERVLFIGGTLDQVHRVLCEVQDKITGALLDANTQQLPPKWRLNQMKIAVANSTCSKIIGNKGEVIKKVRESTDTKITTTPLKQIIGNERVITLSGEDHSVMEALRQILQLVEEDKDAKLQNDVSYKKFVLPNTVPSNPILLNHSNGNASINPANLTNINFAPNAAWGRPGWDMTNVLAGGLNPLSAAISVPTNMAGPSSIHTQQAFVKPKPAHVVTQMTGGPQPLPGQLSSSLELLGAAAAGLGAAAASGNTAAGMNNASMIECLGGLIASIARQHRLNNGQ